ncbi:hypothetical protein D3C85_1452760 [compost metagenome]
MEDIVLQLGSLNRLTIVSRDEKLEAVMTYGVIAYVKTDGKTPDWAAEALKVTDVEDHNAVIIRWNNRGKLVDA